MRCANLTCSLGLDLNFGGCGPATKEILKARLERRQAAKRDNGLTGYILTSTSSLPRARTSQRLGVS